LLGNEDRDLEWHDNRPADRFDSRYRRLVFAVIFLFTIPGGIPIYFGLLVGGLRALALPVAVIFSSGLCAGLSLIVLAVESRFATHVAIGKSGMHWRARSGRTYSIPYSTVLRVLPSQWKGDWSSPFECRRYFVQLTTRIPGVRWNLSLTAENRGRLEKALMKA